MGSNIYLYSGTRNRNGRSNKILQIADKKLQIHQQGLRDGETVARRQPVGSFADKSAVDCGKRVVQLGQVNDVFFGNGGQAPEIFFAKADRAVASVFGEHGQSVGPADDGARCVHATGAVFQQGARTEGIGMAGFVLNTVPQLRRQRLQRQGQRRGFNGIDRNMNPATIAGTPFGTGNLIFMPADDPAAAPIHIGDPSSIVF